MQIHWERDAGGNRASYKVNRTLYTGEIYGFYTINIVVEETFWNRTTVKRNKRKEKVKEKLGEKEGMCDNKLATAV